MMRIERVLSFLGFDDHAEVKHENGQYEFVSFSSGCYHLDTDLMRIIFTLQTASGERVFSGPYRQELIIEMPDGDKAHYLDTDPLGYFDSRSN